MLLRMVTLTPFELQSYRKSQERRRRWSALVSSCKAMGRNLGHYHTRIEASKHGLLWDVRAKGTGLKRTRRYGVELLSEPRLFLGSCPHNFLLTRLCELHGRCRIVFKFGP